MSNRCREDRQQQICTFIAEYYDSKGYSPSYREIANGVGLRSTSTVHYYVKMLEENGRVKSLPVPGNHTRKVASSRSIVLSERERSIPQRVQLNIADGGALCFDCLIRTKQDASFELLFTGIAEVTGMKSGHGRVISCQLSREAVMA